LQESGRGLGKNAFPDKEKRRRIAPAPLVNSVRSFD
jgi:hypothetical protein